ncbi:hypothetical protein [Phaffia rhodozyma]|uniref:Uncharacterized protein n=1 Tax=Phaffia rhodozyma TaxID=264483 RepID=A0A0F7SVT2_PHARH|nr:hypothetical protein [Phaffia rhodozyma]
MPIRQSPLPTTHEQVSRRLLSSSTSLSTSLSCPREKWNGRRPEPWSGKASLLDKVKESDRFDRISTFLSVGIIYLTVDPVLIDREDMDKTVRPMTCLFRTRRAPLLILNLLGLPLYSDQIAVDQSVYF